MNFTQGQNNTTPIQEMSGQLSTTGNSAIDLPDSVQTDTLDPVITVSPIKHPNSYSSSTPEDLIPNPSVQSEFYVDSMCPPISCVGQGLAWVGTDRNKLQLVDWNGVVKDTIRTRFHFIDMTVTSEGDIILADYDHSCIKSVSPSQKKFSTLFRTSSRPFGVCCLSNEDIVVSLCEEDKVVVYSIDGQIRQTLDHIEFKSPEKVAVNKANKDIYIVDRTCLDKGKVIAVGAVGQPRYEYTGQGDKALNPADVCTDHMGHVLIADYNSNSVHILDQEGQFIQYVLTSQQGLQEPGTMDVDTEGYVWVGEKHCGDNSYHGYVKVSRYLC